MAAGPAQSVDEFIAGARHRLLADGNELSNHTTLLRAPTDVIGQTLIAHRSAIRMFGKMDLFTAILALPPTAPLTPELLTQFKLRMKDYALDHVGEQLGSPLGLAVVPILVSNQVTQEGRAAALAERPNKYGVSLRRGAVNPGAFVWAAVADLAVSQSLYYTGWFLTGRVGSEFIREKLLLALGPELAKHGQRL
jgi:hypothetical protein